MAIAVIVNLDNASNEQCDRFGDDRLHSTLAQIKDAVGDQKSIIHVRRDRRTLTYVTQSLEDFNPSMDCMAMYNDYAQRTVLGPSAQNDSTKQGETFEN